jgi:hypothetical protein
LTLPPPEDLGVGGDKAAPAAPVDWAEIHRRMDRLGPISVRQEKLAAGGYRVTMLLPRDKADHSQPVNAEAATLPLALNQALERAEKLALPH